MFCKVVGLFKKGCISLNVSICIARHVIVVVQINDCSHIIVIDKTRWMCLESNYENISNMFRLQNYFNTIQSAQVIVNMLIRNVMCIICLSESSQAYFMPFLHALFHLFICTMCFILQIFCLFKEIVLNLVFYRIYANTYIFNYLFKKSELFDFEYGHFDKGVKKGKF